ncbi:MAG: bifunctional glutamate N-acetyltransferase/amino-acid acetyltransferase ArgJ [Clostridia bacterium]|nr:bifunctional glutamate N-acetyltransferase/amino-acid acetyltransferase ArgJ [Clostridia bacterium]
MKLIDKGVCAPKGFTASGIHCGIRKNKTKKDLALILCDTMCSAASVYTTNLVKGAPIYVTRDNLKNGNAQAILCNSGNANTCNADGIDIAKEMCALLQKHTGIAAEDVIVASTGVIGQPLSIAPIASGMEALVAGLGDKSHDANEAIMTTDTISKEVAVSFSLDGVECRIGGIAKGSGMIHPNMATMLVFLTTDCAISPTMLQKAISADVKDSFNMVSVDGDTSTNDMLSILASGQAGNPVICEDGKAYEIFCNALASVTTYLCRLIAKDGEGATRLIECVVRGAEAKDTARKVAKSVITSSLFKAAIFGADANWGRVLCAIGYSGADVDVTKIDVEFSSAVGAIKVCKAGAGIPFSEEIAKNVLLEKEITVTINLNAGVNYATAWGCDLTYEYVKINGDYRT